MGLVLVIEGLVYGGFPGLARKLATEVLSLPENALRIAGLAAQSASQYAEIALRLANDPDWRRQMGEELRRRKDVLYENAALVRELERFLEAAVAAAVGGRKLQVRGARPPTAYEARGARCS